MNFRVFAVATLLLIAVVGWNQADADLISDPYVKEVQDLISENSIVIFSKSYCPFCKKAKKLLVEFNKKLKIIELNEIDDGAKFQQALQTITGQKTVPNIFIKGKHVGGSDAVDAMYRSGELQKLVNDIPNAYN